MTFQVQAGRILTTPMNLFGNGRSPEMVFSASHWGTEMLGEVEGGIFYWDNARPSARQAQVGDLFGFVFTADGHDEIDLRVIERVLTTEDRRSQWDEDIPGHGNRVAIALSMSIGWVSSTDFVSSGTNAPSRSDNGKMLTINGTASYTWDPSILVSQY